MDSTVCILLASYNGASYIKDQLNSLLNQEYSNWVLFVRDDGSDDDTLNILNSYIQNDDRIFLLPDDGPKNLGSCMNFSALMDYSFGKYKYYMFCDQDDVWLPDKISVAMKQMLSLEEVYSKQTPLLVYTSFIYADEELRIINKTVDLAPSDPADPLSLFRGLFMQNPVYGCTTLFNASLLKRALKIPPAFRFHDYWIAFVAASTGHALFLPKAGLLYRQHPGNVTSVFVKSYFSQRLKRALAFGQIKADILNKVHQVNTISERFQGEMSIEKKQLIKEFLDNVKIGGSSMIRFMLKNKIFPRNKINRFLIMLALLHGINFSEKKIDNESFV